MKKIMVCVLGIAVLIILSCPYTLADELSDLKVEMQKMQEQMRLMQSRIETLEQEGNNKDAIRKSQYLNDSVLNQNQNPPLFVNMKNSTLTLHGYLQAYYAWFEHNSGNDTFETRRAFVTLDGKMSDDVSGRIQVDVAASSDILRDAYINFTHFPYTKIKVGQFKVPFSYEWLTSSAELDTIQRALSTTNFSTDRDLGIMLEGETPNKKMYYAAGIFNGTGRNTSDTNENKDFIGRVAMSPFRSGNDVLAGYLSVQVFRQANRP